MREHRVSRAAYRLLLRTYPREFRERFARDLEIDFLEMARSRGAAFAWRRALSDVFRAVPLTASDAAAEGRTFLAGEDQGDSSVAIISHGLWRRRFGGRSAIGSTIVIERRPFTVVGVMAAGFEFPRRGASSNATPASRRSRHGFSTTIRPGSAR
jgi:hypothetical protein